MQSTETNKKKNLKHPRSLHSKMPLTNITASNTLDDCVPFPVEEIVQSPLRGLELQLQLQLASQDMFFAPPDGGLDEDNLLGEEKLMRERSRESGLGIYFQDVSSQPEIKLPSASSSPIIYPHSSPDDTMLAYVKDSKLHVLDLLCNKSKQLTSGADRSTIKSSSCFHICPLLEEMERRNSYWWSLDSKFIAFTQVNSSNIPLFRIMHQGKSNVGAGAHEDHAYPFAGASNVKVHLGVVYSSGGSVTWMDLLPGEKDQTNSDEENLAQSTRCMEIFSLLSF
ncbi:hypothetical protein LguiB_003774 [Lonicera macranthoides]